MCNRSFVWNSSLCLQSVHALITACCAISKCLTVSCAPLISRRSAFLSAEVSLVAWKAFVFYPLYQWLPVRRGRVTGSMGSGYRRARLCTSLYAITGPLSPGMRHCYSLPPHRSSHSTLGGRFGERMQKNSGLSAGSNSRLRTTLRSRSCRLSPVRRRVLDARWASTK